MNDKNSEISSVRQDLATPIPNVMISQRRTEDTKKTSVTVCWNKDT
jgi:hypothetical protein